MGSNPFAEILLSGKDKTKNYEGFSSDVYKDSVGKRTVGYGFNLEDTSIDLHPDVVSGKRPITKQESDTAFDKRYSIAEKDARKFLGDSFNKLNQDQKDTVVDMAYNMGYARLSTFKKFKASVQEGNWGKAAEELKNSKWYGQTGRRAKEHYSVFKQLAEINPFQVKEAEASEEPIEGNPFKDIVGSAEQVANPFKDIGVKELNPFQDIVTAPSVFKPESTFTKDAISGIVADITAIPYRLMGTRAPAEGALFKNVPSVLEWLSQPIGKKTEVVPGSWTEEKGWQYKDRDVPRWESMIESGTEIATLGLVGASGLQQLFSTPQAQQILSKIAFKPYTSGTPGTANFIEGSSVRKGFDWLAKRVAPMHPAFQPVETKTREDLMLERLSLLEEGPEKEATKRLAQRMGIDIPDEPIFKPAVPSGKEIAFQGSRQLSEAESLMKEVKSAERLIPIASTKPKTLLNWTIKSGRIRASSLQEFLGKEWREDLPFSVGKKDGRDPVELYEEATREGLIPPMPPEYTGGEGQYFLDQLKSSKGKFLEQAVEFEDDIVKEYEAFLESEKAHGKQAIESTEIKSVEADLGKKDLGELIQEAEGDNGVVYFDTNKQADGFITEIEKSGGSAEIRRVREDGVVEVGYTKEISVADEQYKANLETNLKQYETKQNKTPEDLQYIAETKAKIQQLTQKLTGNPLDVEPTIPAAGLKPKTDQQVEQLFTELKYGLSPQVQRTIFENANDSAAKLTQQEKAGRILLPSGGQEETLIKDPQLKAALYAGRKKTSYLGSGLVNWLKESAKSIWEGIKLEYEPTLKDYPQLQDDLRTGPISFGRKAREQSELALGGLIGDLNGHQEDIFWNVIGMRDLVARGGEGLKLPRDLKVADIQGELTRVFENAPQAVKDAVAKYDKLMTGLGEDLISREKLGEGELKSNYFPHYVLDYMPSWWDDTSAFLPKRLRQPYRSYIKQAVGSAKDIAISKEALVWHLSSIFMDNAIDDWAVEQLTKYDKIGLTGAQLKDLGPVRPNDAITIGDKKYRGFQYQPGRQMYPAQMTNPSALNKALEGNLSTQDWMASTGPRGGAAVREGMTFGRYNKVYLLPQEIYDRFIKLKAPYAGNPFLALALPATGQWKRITLDFAGLPFQGANLFGDFVNFYRTSPGATGEVGSSLSILRHLRDPGKLTEWQQHVLKVAHDKDVMGAGFVNEYAHITPLVSPKGLLEKIERFSSLREGVLRLAMLSYQMKRTEVGLPVHAPEYAQYVAGLDKTSAAAYVARNFTVDYLAIPDWYRQWIRGFVAPFATFYHINAKNWAKYAKNDTTGLFIKFMAPLIGLWAYNNTGDRKKVEERLPDYWRFRPFKIHLKQEDLDGDGTPDRALIWSMQTPFEMAGALVGLDRIGDKVTLMRAGKMTAKEAALNQLADFGLGAVRTGHLLLNPMIQFFEGVTSNRDPRTRQEVVPSELERADETLKKKYQLRYLIEKIAVPFGQYLKDQRGTEHTNLLMSGPLDIQRALGFYWVNLQGADARVDMNETRKRRGEYDTYMYRIEQRYLEGRKFDDIEKEAANEGILLNVRSINDRLNSPRVQIDKVKSELRKTTEPNERRRLEIELDGLVEDRVREYEKTIPKGARK